MHYPTVKLTPIKQKLAKIFTVNRIELILSLYVSFYLMLYGFGKIMKGQFTFDGPLLEKAAKELTGFELTWIFFGYAYSYVLIIGLGQIIGAILLIPRITRILGALTLIPILVNIVLVDIFYGIPHGATVNAIFFLFCTLVILWIHKEKMKKVLQIFLLSSSEKFTAKLLLVYAALSIVGIVALEVMKMILSNVLKSILY